MGVPEILASIAETALLPGKTDDFTEMPAGTTASPNEIVFFCEKKNITVRGIINTGFSLGLSSDWKSLIGGTGSVGSAVVDVAETVSQVALGKSIRQPWFTRPTWNGTSVIETEFKFKFIADKDAKTEVWVPFWCLMALLSPRQYTDLSSVLGTQLNSKFEGAGADIDPAIKGALKSMATSIGVYVPPGPGFFNFLQKGTDADPVIVTIGNLITWNRCFLTKVNATFSAALSLAGYPLEADVSVSIKLGDVLTSNFITDSYIGPLTPQVDKSAPTSPANNQPPVDKNGVPKPESDQSIGAAEEEFPTG